MTTHALPMPAVGATSRATLDVARLAAVAVGRFLLDVLTVLLDLLATIVWTAVASVFVYLAGLASFKNGGPQAMSVTLMLGANLVSLGLGLWLSMVLLPRYRTGDDRG